MKKILLSVLLVIGLTACSSNQEPTPDQTPEPTPEVTPEATIEPTPEVTPEVTAEPTTGYIWDQPQELREPTEKINIAGLFDVLVSKDKPEQMEFKYYVSDHLYDDMPYGTIWVEVVSNDPGCDPHDHVEDWSCTELITSYAFGSKKSVMEDTGYSKNEEGFDELIKNPPMVSGLPAALAIENEKYGTVYIGPTLITYSTMISNTEELPSYMRGDQYYKEVPGVPNASSILRFVK